MFQDFTVFFRLLVICPIRTVLLSLERASTHWSMTFCLNFFLTTRCFCRMMLQCSYKYSLSTMTFSRTLTNPHCSFKSSRNLTRVKRRWSRKHLNGTHDIKPGSLPTSASFENDEFEDPLPGRCKQYTGVVPLEVICLIPEATEQLVSIDHMLQDAVIKWLSDSSSRVADFGIPCCMCEG